MSYNYNQVYYYEHDCTDFSTTGECGDLMPVECLFEEQKNGLSRITMRLAYDPWRKWSYPKVGGYIKAAVPVRVPPQIVDGDYATTVARYEPTSSRVNVYVRQDENAPITAVVNVGQRIYGKNTPAIIENFIPTVLKPYETDAPDEKRLLGYFKRSSVRKVEEISIVPASYGMESITDLVTRLADQYFQIVEVTQGDEYVDVVAEHVFYELLTDYTSYKPDAQTEISGSTCVNQILAKAYGNAGRFNISSSSSKTLKGIDFERKNIVEALLDPEKGACALYGMVLLRDNWDIYCLPEEDVGYDRGFVVEYGKNLASIKHTEDISQTITRIFPFGKTAKGEAYFISTGVKCVDSTHIDDYGAPRVMLLDTGITIGKDGVTASNIDAKLREAAQNEYDENKIDVPRLTMEIDFVSLGDTEEYAQFRGLDKVYLYDKIKIIDRFRGYQYAAEVVGVVHNVRTGVLEKVTLGSLDNTDAKRKVAVWQVPEVDGTNIRLKSIGLGVLGEGSVDSDAILNGAITGAKIANLAIGTAQIDNAAITSAKIGEAEIKTANIDNAAITKAKMGEASIGDAQIESAGINYAKIKELNAESAFFGQGVFQNAVGEKLYVPRLMFDDAQGRQMMVKDLVIGASNGKYYHLDVSETATGIKMTPTELTVSAAEIAAGHTNDGQPIIGTTATVQDLASESLFAIDAVIDKITAKKINVDELWARQAFVDKLMVQDISSNTYIRLAINNAEAAAISAAASDATTKANNAKNSAVSTAAADATTKANNAQTAATNAAAADATTKANAAQAAAIAVANQKYAIQTGIDIGSAGLNLAGNKYIRMQTNGNTTMQLSDAGFDMLTAGKFVVHAKDQNGSIIFGTDASNASFAVGDQGNLHANSIDTNSLTVNGVAFPNHVISDSQPSGHGILWIKPSSTTEKSWVYTPENRVLSQVGGTLGRYRDYTIAYSAADYLAGNLFYGIIGSLYVYAQSAVGNSYNFKAILNPASQNITIGQTSGRIYTQGTNINLNVMMPALATNVMNPNGGSFILRIETDCNQNYCRLDGSLTLKAKSQSSAGVSACSLFYIS